MGRTELTLTPMGGLVSAVGGPSSNATADDEAVLEEDGSAGDGAAGGVPSGWPRSRPTSSSGAARGRAVGGGAGMGGDGSSGGGWVVPMAGCWREGMMGVCGSGRQSE